MSPSKANGLWAIFRFRILRRRWVGDPITIDGQWKSGEDDMMLDEITIIGTQHVSQGTVPGWRCSG